MKNITGSNLKSRSDYVNITIDLNGGSFPHLYGRNSYTEPLLLKNVEKGSSLDNMGFGDIKKTDNNDGGRLSFKGTGKHKKTG